MNCNGSCNQGRACDCAPDMPTEYPPLTGKSLAIAVAVVALSALASYFIGVPQ